MINAPNTAPAFTETEAVRSGKKYHRTGTRVSGTRQTATAYNLKLHHDVSGHSSAAYLFLDHTIISKAHSKTRYIFFILYKNSNKFCTRSVHRFVHLARGRVARRR